MAYYKRFGECAIVDLHPGRQPCAHHWIYTKDFTALQFPLGVMWKKDLHNSLLSGNGSLLY